MATSSRPTTRHIGTPIGGERKSRRIGSPLDELDGMTTNTEEDVAETDFEEQFKDADAKTMMMTMMGMMTNVQNEIKAMKSGMGKTLDETKQKADQATMTVKMAVAAVENVEKNIKELDAKFINLSENTVKKKDVDELVNKHLKKNIQSVDHSRTNAASSGPHNHNDIMAQTLVFGGFCRESDGQAEVDWLTSKIKEMSVSIPESIYYKGDEFKGLLFAKLQDAEAASKTMDDIKKNKTKFGDKDIWYKPDSPVEVRVVRSLLLGLRWQLGEWKSLKENAIKIDVPSSTMEVGDDIVATVHVEEDKLKILWHNETWKE